MPTSRSRYRRRGFGGHEYLVTTPIMLAIGIAITYATRWLLSTDHWLTWIPTGLLAVPFLVIYGVRVPMSIIAILKEKRDLKAKKNEIG